MRRLALLPVLAIGLLAGCSQVAQVAGDAAGVDVAQICTGVEDVYAQYQDLLDAGATSGEQVDAARENLVSTLNDLGDDIGGQVGDTLAQHADRLAEAGDLQAPETIAAVEDLKNSLDAFCG